MGYAEIMLMVSKTWEGVEARSELMGHLHRLAWKRVCEGACIVYLAPYCMSYAGAVKLQTPNGNGGLLWQGTSILVYLKLLGGVGQETEDSEEVLQIILNVLSVIIGGLHFSKLHTWHSYNSLEMWAHWDVQIQHCSAMWMPQVSHGYSLVITIRAISPSSDHNHFESRN